MSALPETEYHVGDRVCGFRLEAVHTLEEQRAVAYEFEHGASGARLLYLRTEDPENLFSVTFLTPPPDDTGLPHILEHAVLAGSREYPVRDPFFEMVKMSMATFINAMTAPDFTCYPAASNVKQDLLNLSDVYFDAVFHPLITKEIFEREGHHLGVGTDADGTRGLTVSGIVYNEMKGVASTPESRLYRCLAANLYGGTTYGYWAGGDPEHIPDLAYEDFRAFYELYYHPANARFFLYGDIPVEEQLSRLNEKLRGFNRRVVEPEITLPARWPAPRAVEDVYAIGADENDAEKTYLQLHWLLGSGTDARYVTSMDILSRVLLGHEAAPLRKALVDSGLGQDLGFAGFSEQGRTSTFSVGLKGSEADRGEAFMNVVRETLTRLAEESIDPAAVEAAFRQAAYAQREVEETFPLHLMFRVMQSWLYGGDPLLFLNMREHMAWCRERHEQDPRWLNGLVREQLLDNPHRLMVTLKPDRTFRARTEACFGERMRALRATLSEARVDDIAAHAADLDRASGTPNPPEALARLPQLKVRDLPAGPRHIPTSVDRLESGVELLSNEVFANGVNYLQLDFDLRGLPASQWAYVPRYADAVRKLGAAGMGYEAVARRMAAATGGVECQPYVGTHIDGPARRVWGLRLGLKTLDEQAEPALALLHDLLFAVDPGDRERLYDVTTQARAACRRNLTGSGQRTPGVHAGRGLTPEGHLAHRMGGLPQLHLLDEATDRYEDSRAALMAMIESIRDFLTTSCPLTVSFTGTPAVEEKVRSALKDWTGRMGSRDVVDAPGDFVPYDTCPAEGLAAPIQVAHCARVAPAPHFSHPDAHLLTIAAHLLNFDYLISEVRLKGNAYGAWCRYDGPAGLLKLGSFSDPHPARTLGVFERLPDYARGVDWSQDDVDRAIIGTARSDERPIRPEEATSLALRRHRMGITRAIREERYQRLLGVTGADAKRAFLDMLHGYDRQSAVCVLASRPELEAAGRDLPRPLAIEDILK